MKQQSTIEAIYALVFAACVLLALLLLTGCGKTEEPPPEQRPTVQGQTVTFPPGSPA